MAQRRLMCRDEFPMILVGNKADLESERQVRLLEHIIHLCTLRSRGVRLICKVSTQDGKDLGKSLKV